MQPYFGSTLVDGTMATDQVAWAVLRKHFSAMVANEQGTIEGSDPEKLHDMRVATRRMRAALSVFKKWLPAEVSSHNDSLRWIATALGSVRDLDVQVQHHRDWAKQLDAEPKLEKWFELMSAERDALRARLTKDIQSERYQAFVDSFGELIKHPPEGVNQEPIVMSAPLFVTKRWRNLKKAIDACNLEAPDSQLHAARIIAKRFRYSVEFVTPVYGPLGKAVSSDAADLQDVLGLHQDCVVAGDYIKDHQAIAFKRLNANAVFELGKLSSFVEVLKDQQRQELAKVFDQLRRESWP